MILQNKQTGDVIECEEIIITKRVEDAFTNPYTKTYRAFSSIAELNEELEDYKPTEPLIKDEKIRKAIRAWAEVLNIEGVSIEHRCAGELCEVHSVFCGLSMEFDGSIMSDIQDGDYTITELCGEEEE